MNGQEVPRGKKKPYCAPRMVDFGAIELVTGECVGTCIDGENGAGRGDWP